MTCSILNFIPVLVQGMLTAQYQFLSLELGRFQQLLHGDATSSPHEARVGCWLTLQIASATHPCGAQAISNSIYITRWFNVPPIFITYERMSRTVKIILAAGSVDLQAEALLFPQQLLVDGRICDEVFSSLSPHEGNIYRRVAFGKQEPAGFLFDITSPIYSNSQPGKAVAHLKSTAVKHQAVWNGEQGK
jgi:hypothetical protein